MSADKSNAPRTDGAFRHLLKGVCIGMADPVPGVSAATIAYITGLYDRLIMAIHQFRAGGWRGNLALILPVAAGMLLGIFLLASIIEAALDARPHLVRQVFTGLVFGGLWLIVKGADVPLDRRTVPAVLTTAALLLLVLAFLPHPPVGEPIREPTQGQTAFIFVAGIVAAAGMTVPGLSGALLQVVIGSYATYVTAVRELNLLVLAVFYAGAIVGIVGMANLLGAIFERHHLAAHVLIAGLVFGSAIHVWPLEAEWRVQALGIPVAGIATLAPILLSRLQASGRPDAFRR